MATFNKKKKFLLVTAALLLTGGVAAAYWTYWWYRYRHRRHRHQRRSQRGADQRGHGHGSRAPQPQTLSGNFTNTDTRPLYVTSLAVTIASVESAAGVRPSAARPTTTRITGSPLAIGYQALVDDTTTWGTGDRAPTIAFDNEAAENQDGCKNADSQPGLRRRLIKLTSN